MGDVKLVMFQTCFEHRWSILYVYIYTFVNILSLKPWLYPSRSCCSPIKNGKPALWGASPPPRGINNRSNSDWVTRGLLTTRTAVLEGPERLKQCSGGRGVARESGNKMRNRGRAAMRGWSAWLHHQSCMRPGFEPNVTVWGFKRSNIVSPFSMRLGDHVNGGLVYRR